ncbi:DUF3023 domain-containing protein [Ehrlichia sp. JZT12]
MLSQEQGIQEDCLITYRGLADYLNYKMSDVNRFNVGMIYMIGRPGIGGKLSVEIAQCRNSRDLLIRDDMEGKFLFLLEGELPGDVEDPYFERLGKSYSIYFLVDSDHIDDFMGMYIKVCTGTLKNDKNNKSGYTVDNLNRYGKIVLTKMNNSEIEKLFFGNKFDEHYALSKIVELEADFIIKENTANGESCSGSFVEAKKDQTERKLFKSLSEKFHKSSKSKYEKIASPREKIKNPAASVGESNKLKAKWYVESVSNKNALYDITYL